MRYPPSETAEKHTRTLQAAARLFRERGFSGASISEIMTATGLTHGSFYNHFDSKENLLAEALEHASQENLAGYDAYAKTSEGKKALYGDYLCANHRDNRGTACAMTVLGTDFQDLPQARSVLTGYIRNTITKLAERFPWSPRRSARKQAIRALASMVGAMLLARAVDDPELSDEILKEVLESLYGG